MSIKDEKIAIENINIPNKVTNVNAAKYHAMKKALLLVLPKKSPGLTQNEMMADVKAHLPEKLFPKGATSGWWAKTVQLDLEAKKIIVRESCKPLRWHQAE